MANNEMAYVANAAITKGQVLRRLANNAAGDPVCDVATDGAITAVPQQVLIGVADADYAAGERLTPSRGFVWAQIALGLLTPGTDYRLTVGLLGRLVSTAATTDQIVATFEGAVATGGTAGELVRVCFQGSTGSLAIS